MSKELSREDYLMSLEIGDLADILGIKLFGITNPNSSLNDVVNRDPYYLKHSVDLINQLTVNKTISVDEIKLKIIRMISGLEHLPEGKL